MSIIWTVFKKELVDTLRDKRTLLTAIILPALLLPILGWGIGKVSMTILNKEKNKKLKVAILEAPPAFLATIDTSKIELRYADDIQSGGALVKSDSLDVLIGFDAGFNDQQQNMKSSTVNMWYKSTNITVLSRIKEMVENYENSLLDERITALDISQNTIDPINFKPWDIAPVKEQMGQTVGGYLPYMFILFCFSGCMYPALDLVTGEKERGTIETLLTVPASRFKILMGKVLTIALMGLAAAIMGILGLVVAGKYLPDMPEKLFEVMNSMISIKFIGLLIIMLIPLCFFFAGALSAMVIKAKSFKEAQSIVSPFMGLVFVPAILALLPGIDLDWTTAFIPILNISLATKEIISGTLQTGHFIAIVGSLVLLAIAAVAISYRQFSKEGMVLK